MILHTDRYFEHRYDVKLDLVCVKWPSIESIFLPEILHSVSILAENVINFNIRNLLIDASESHLKSSNEEANQVVFLLMDGLKRSRLEKLARIESSNLIREEMLKHLIAEMNNTILFETRFFKDQGSALRWLEAS